MKVSSFLKKLLVAVFTMVLVIACGKKEEPVAKSGELAGEIVFWHSFTQGQRLETIQKAADIFMEKHPKVKIKIETFSWNDFYTKWTTGLASGNVPDLSTGLQAQITEMTNVDAIVPINDVIDKIGRDKFSQATLLQGTVNGKEYSIPLYSHAQVMWVRKDLLKENNLEVPKTWNEFYSAAKTLTKDGVYGFSVPFGTTDFIATRFLNLYVRSAGGSLLTKDKKVDLTSPLAQEGISFLVKLYDETSPKDSINFNVLQQATLFYQGKTAFDFNSGFHIGGVKANSPELLNSIDAFPVPKYSENSPQLPLEASTISLAVWKNSKHPEIVKAFVESLYEKEIYIKFLQSVPVGMLPVIKGISTDPLYLANPIVKQFEHAEKVIANAVEIGSEIGYEHGPSIEAGIIVNNHIIEKMFQEIVTGKKSQIQAAQDAEKELNEIITTTVGE